MKTYLLAVAMVLANQATANGLPKNYQERYKTLLRQKIIEKPNGHKQLGDARLFVRDGVRVLYLKGDRFEMAYQHGRLLKDIISLGAMPQIASMLENAARNSFPKNPVVVDPIIKSIYKTYSRSILSHAAKNTGTTIDAYIVEAHGLSAGSGLPLEQIVYAFLNPEMLQVILGQQMKGSKNLPSPMAVNECTDFAIDPKYTEHSGYIIGRNTDYSLNGFFDKYPTVLYYDPTDGSQPYMAITSAGVHTAGVVGYNSSGLFLGVHTIPTWDTSKNGHPIFDVAQLILRQAKTFDEAINYFKRMLPAAGWTYTLVSTKEKRSASIEVTNSKLSVRETTGNIHAQSNHFLTSEMRSRNLNINASINEDSRARYDRTIDLITSTIEPFTARRAVQILADKIDPYSQNVKSIGNVVATHFTVTSAVLDTGLGSLYLASGLAPTSLTTFVELPLIDRFNPETFEQETYKTITEDSYHKNYPVISNTEQLYISAKNAFEIENDPVKSKQILKQAVALDPENSAYIYMLGLMSIKANDFAAAKDAFKVCAGVAIGHHKLTCLYFSAKVSGAFGDNDNATNLFEEVLSLADPHYEAPLIEAAKKNLSILKRTKRITLNPDTLGIFMPEADVLAY